MANRRLARAKAALRTGKLGHSRLARAVALGILLGGASALPAAVQAANSDWTGATSDEWSDDSNWVVPPVNGSFVLIDALDPNDTHLRAPASVDAVLVGDQGEEPCRLRLAPHRRADRPRSAVEPCCLV
jgi:hypothetical protein